MSDEHPDYDRKACKRPIGNRHDWALTRGDTCYPCELDRLTKENERLTNLISSSGGLKCPSCDDVGFTAFQVNETDWEQSQCEFCYTVDDSIFMRGQS